MCISIYKFVEIRLRIHTYDEAVYLYTQCMTYIIHTHGLVNVSVSERNEILWKVLACIL